MGATPQDDLREELAARRAVVIVGAGVSVAATAKAATASWVGLLEDGIAYCQSLLGPRLPAGWSERRRAALASGDTEELIGVAEGLHPPARRSTRGRVRPLAPGQRRKPGGHQAGGTGGPCRARGAAGATNYDGLLEAATGRPAVTWRQGALAQQVVRGDHDAILHLHGHWQDPPRWYWASAPTRRCWATPTPWPCAARWPRPGPWCSSAVGRASPTPTSGRCAVGRPGCSPARPTDTTASA